MSLGGYYQALVPGVDTEHEYHLGPYAVKRLKIDFKVTTLHLLNRFG